MRGVEFLLLHLEMRPSFCISKYFFTAISMTAFDTAFVTKALIAHKPADHSMKEIYTVFNPAS